MKITINNIQYYIADRKDRTYDFDEHKTKQRTAGGILRQDIIRQDTLNFTFQTMPLKEIVTGTEQANSKFIVTRISDNVPIGAMQFVELIKSVGGAVGIVDKHFYNLTPFYAIITLQNYQSIHTVNGYYAVLSFAVEEV